MHLAVSLMQRYLTVREMATDSLYLILESENGIFKILLHCCQAFDGLLQFQLFAVKLVLVQMAYIAAFHTVATLKSVLPAYGLIQRGVHGMKDSLVFIPVFPELGRPHHPFLLLLAFSAYGNNKRMAMGRFLVQMYLKSDDILLTELFATPLV